MEAVADTSQKFEGSIVQKLEAAIGAENVKTSKFERLLYNHDLAPLPKEAQLGFKNIPDVVVRPSSAEDVAKIVKIAASEGMPITPRGASTWGLCGSVPAFGGIMLDMVAKMNKIIEVDVENMTITAQGGASWKNVYDAAWEKGFLLGSYPSSFPSSSIAGWLSTNGIGIGSYKYGGPGDNIRDMVVVTPNGMIVNTGFKTLSDAMSGYNLNRLFVGAEGTLGVICEVTFKLVPRPEVLKPLSYTFEKLDMLGAPIKAITRSRTSPLHIAWSDTNHFKMLRKLGHEVPAEVASLLIVVLEGDKAIVEYEEKVIDEIATKAGGKKMPDAFSQHEWDERAYEFRIRELGLGAVPGEVLVPTSSFANMANDMYELMDSMKMEAAIIGVMGDRNTCLVMPYYVFDAASLTKSMVSLAFDVKAGEVAAKNGGRMLGGFGLFFGPNLKNVRGEGGYAVDKSVKEVLDPKEIMNPGKLLGMKTRFGLPVTAGMLGLGMDMMAVVKKILPKDNMLDKKATAMEYEELDKERATQHKVDPLREEKK